MSSADLPQIYDREHVNDIPKGQLLRLLEPVVADSQEVARIGEYLVISKVEHLPLFMRLTFEELKKKAPEAGYVLLNIRNLVALVMLVSKLHDGAGETFTAGTTRSTPGLKRDILPSLITAESVKITTLKAGDLPKGQPLVLAASYQCSDFDDVMGLARIEEDDVANFGGLPEVAIITDGLYIRRGMWFSLIEEDGCLLMKKWNSDETTITIDPDFELEVWVPEEAKAKPECIPVRGWGGGNVAVG